MTESVEAVARMIQGGALAASECEIRFIGGGAFGESLEVRAAVEAAGLSGSVAFLPRVPYEESLRGVQAAIRERRAQLRFGAIAIGQTVQ